MSASMVRALLDGSNTQTRRIINPQPNANHRKVTHCYSMTLGRESDETVGYAMFENEDSMGYEIRCPYRVAGDRLWVRESLKRCGRYAFYAQDGTGVDNGRNQLKWKWKRNTLSARFMPKIAARIWLEITRVRVERVEDISEEDAKAEGIQYWRQGSMYWRQGSMLNQGFRANNQLFDTAKEAYACLWDSLHGKGARARNDWVWVLEFKKL